MILKNLLFLLTILVVSCNLQTSNFEETKKIDKLLLEVDTISYELSKVEIESLVSIHESIKADMDTIDNIKELKRLMEIQNHLIEALDWYNNIHREITYARNHLESIKEPIQAGEKADSDIVHQLKKESNILKDLSVRCEKQIKKLGRHIKNIKKQYAGYE